MNPSLRGWRGGGRWPGGGPGDWPSCLDLAVARSSSGTLTNCRDLSGLGNVRASNTSHVKLFTCRLGINQLDILPQKNHKRALIEIIIKGEPSSFPYHCGSVKCYQWWIFRIGNWSNEMWERGRCLVLVVIRCFISPSSVMSWYGRHSQRQRRWTSPLYHSQTPATLVTSHTVRNGRVSFFPKLKKKFCVWASKEMY